MSVNEINVILKGIGMLEADIENAKENIKSLRKLALTHCPFNIGDRIKANGYAHKGKVIEIKI